MAANAQVATNVLLCVRNLIVILVAALGRAFPCNSIPRQRDLQALLSTRTGAYTIFRRAFRVVQGREVFAESAIILTLPRGERRHRGLARRLVNRASACGPRGARRPASTDVI
jgi:hypothetical protein